VIRVLIESPYAGDVERNVRYARAAMADSLRRGEAPYASHLLLTQVLDDSDPAQRTLGIEAGLIWGKAADLTAVYADLGISRGMQLGIERARVEGRPVETRLLSGEWAAKTLTRYELVNPSDPYTLEAPTLELACVAAVILGEGMYGLRTADGETAMPVLLFKAQEWWRAQFGRSVEESLATALKSPELAAVFGSLALPAGHSTTSLNDIGAYARDLAQRTRRRAAVEVSRG
jgi:hypothetical protein